MGEALDGGSTAFISSRTTNEYPSALLPIRKPPRQVGSVSRGRLATCLVGSRPDPLLGEFWDDPDPSRSSYRHRDRHSSETALVHPSSVGLR